MTDPNDARPRSTRGPVVLLAGPGDTTDIVANHLAAQVEDPVVIVEQPPSRRRMATRRAKRIGWSKVLGQVLFVAGALPLLRRRGDDRIRSIVGTAGADPTPHRIDHHVASVNDPATIDLLRTLDPAVVVVQGTRIIGRDVLTAVDCPFINTHAGITPRYRGVHGGYWALAGGRPDLVGTTVHLVDPGIDTGGILAQATFVVTADDTVATYPYLHLVAGLPLLATEVNGVLEGRVPVERPSRATDGESKLYLHPTLWKYLATRWTTGTK